MRKNFNLVLIVLWAFVLGTCVESWLLNGLRKWTVAEICLCLVFLIMRVKDEWNA